MRKIFLGTFLFFVVSSSGVRASPTNCNLNIYPQPTAGTHRYTITLTNNSSTPAYYFSNVFWFGGQPGGQASNILSDKSNYWYLVSVHGYDVTGSAGVPIANGSITYQVDLTSGNALTGIDIGMASQDSPINDICSQGSGDYSITYDEIIPSPTPIPEPTPLLPPIAPTNCSLNIYPQPFIGTHRYEITLTNNTSALGYTFENNFWIDGSALGHPANVTSSSDWYVYAPNGSLSGMPSYQVKGTAGTPLANNSLNYSVDLTINNSFNGVDIGLSSYLASPVANNICNQEYGTYTITFNPPPTTPTPTPTVTPSPAPTSSPSKKVVVVPGIEATWNSDALLNCKMNDYSGDWSLGDYATKYYQPLYDSLATAGWDVEPFYYDWRQPISVSAERLKQFIELNTNSGEKVNLVGHSMGGLIGREYVSEEQDSNRLERMLTAGTPHKGAVVAYPAWSAGDLWKSNLVEKIALTLLLKRCDVWPTHDKTAIRKYIPSIRDLLPIFDYLEDKKTGLFRNATLMESKNDWLLGSNFASPFWGVKIGTLAGRGQSTLTNLDVRDRNLIDQLLGNWEDGKPAGKNLVKNGDDTVLVENAQLTEADNRVVSQRHANLIASSEAIAEISDFLGTPIEAVSGLVEPGSALVIAGVGAVFEISDPSGKVIKDKNGLIVIYDPLVGGKYKLTILEVGGNTWVGVARFKSSGDVEWKEYQGKEAKRTGEVIEWK